MNAAPSMRAILLAAVLGLPEALGGCLIIPSPNQHTGNEVPEQQVKTIQPGKTTKQELFALFGAPMAIAAQGEETAILAPTELRGVGKVPESRKYYEIPADTMFELFSARHTLTEYDRVYYYYYATSWMLEVLFPLVVSKSGETTIDRLWVLMNERTGIVEDYVYRKHM
jgi:hypothetical protein